MHPIIRTSLLGSIQTIRAVLLGMESMLKNMDTEQKITFKKDEIEEEQLDLKELAKVIGLVEVQDGN
jgi:hypothetical protein